MTEEQMNVIDQLRLSGHVVVVWTPEELGEYVDTEALEDRMTSLGADMIEEANQREGG